ncbi:MAG: hypothetical protein KIT17_00775 [Rubrivivax sp.]|nr:hypothetical protein [Rubrivivax sp.]
MRRRTTSTSLAATLILAAGVLGAGTARADTLASSAIFNSFSASVGSISTSFNASSDASSPGRPVRSGEYRVQQIVAAAGREGYAQLTLVALPAGQDTARGTAAPAEGARHDAEAGAPVQLFLPLQTVARAALAAGHVISARERPYGLELAKVTGQGEARTREPFFLVVSDERWRELQTRPVTL